MCFIQDLLSSVEKWQIGGTPLTGLLHFEMRKGRRKPVIQKALVDLQGKAFSRFAEERKKWALDDNYRYPGPIQFYGPPCLTDSIPHSLQSTVF
ncbi:MAG: hypothetical protein HYZ48_05265 [Chlamydiales bacterium]|nr:hypothetical protein [Chlamydiales bacterium]